MEKRQKSNLEESLAKEKIQRKSDNQDLQTVRKQLNELTESAEKETRHKNEKIKHLQEELEDLKR